MKKLYLLMLFIAVAINASAFSGKGSGTVEDPYLISDVDQLYEMHNNLSASYKLTTDISLTEFIQDDNPTRGWDPIGNSQKAFTGTFDGGGHVISGLFINRTTDNIGLFGYINQAIVENFTLVNVKIKGGSNVGSVVGLTTSSRVKNISLINIDVVGDNNIGGIAGTGAVSVYEGNPSYLNNGIDSICNNVIIEGKVTGKSNVGGIVGLLNGNNDIHNMKTKISFSSDATIHYITGNYAFLNVEGDNYIGGICGYESSECTPNVMDNRFDGNIKGTQYAGGIVGYTNNSTVGYDYSGSLHTTHNTVHTVERNISCGALNGNIAGGIGIVQDEKGKALTSNNFCLMDSIIASTNAYRITNFNPYYSNNYALSTTLLKVNGVILEVNDDLLNGTGNGKRTLMRQTTYEGHDFDFSKQWAIVNGKTYPYNIEQSAPATVEEFFSGTSTRIKGTADGDGKVYVIYGDKVYEDEVTNGNWRVTLKNVAAGDVVYVSVATNGKKPSIAVAANAEENPDQPASSVIKTIDDTKTKYASFSAPFNVTVPEGVTVYTASINNVETSVLLTEEKNCSVIPANTGVIISGATGTYTFTATTASGSSLSSTNELIATSKTPTIPSKGIYYGLSSEEEKFVQLAGGTVLGGNEAYIRNWDDATAATLTIDFDKIVNGINNIKNNNSNGALRIYDLNGRERSKLQRGINIVRNTDGSVKKVIVK